MRILLDVDGVIADLVGDLCTYLYFHGHPVLPEHFTTYDFDKCLTPEQLTIVRNVMSKRNFVREMSWYEGAKKFVASLHELGEVIAVTKPYAHGPTWAYERALWLEGYVDKVVSTPHKEFIPGDILIEDNAQNVASWQADNAWGKTVLIERPWCKPDGLFHYVKTYNEILACVTKVKERKGLL